MGALDEVAILACLDGRHGVGDDTWRQRMASLKDFLQRTFVTRLVTGLQLTEDISAEGYVYCALSVEPSSSRSRPLELVVSPVVGSDVVLDFETPM